MLGFKTEPITAEEVSKEQLKKRNEALQVAAKLNNLVNAETTGWKEFINLVDNYIDSCKKRKAITALDRADNDMIYMLKLLDHEIFILNWVKKIPEQFIKKAEQKPEEEQDAE
jgi:hypothetical protein